MMRQMCFPLVLVIAFPVAGNGGSLFADPLSPFGLDCEAQTFLLLDSTFDPLFPIDGAFRANSTFSLAETSEMSRSDPPSPTDLPASGKFTLAALIPSQTQFGGMGTSSSTTSPIPPQLPVCLGIPSRFPDPALNDFAFIDCFVAAPTPFRVELFRPPRSGS
jgi:hypothetical protein